MRIENFDDAYVRLYEFNDVVSQFTNDLDRRRLELENRPLSNELTSQMKSTKAWVIDLLLEMREHTESQQAGSTMTPETKPEVETTTTSVASTTTDSSSSSSSKATRKKKESE